MNETNGKVENVIIIGSGPAGYTAALYTARADLEPLVFEGFAWGGLLQQTTEVENYPGYRDGVMGPEMMQEFRDQAERFGARLVTEDVDRVELAEDGGVHKVFVGDTEYRTKSVILAMGAEPKKLGVPGEDELAARGVSYCATCDAAFFRDKPTIVVGGGDTAMEDALFLAKFAKDVKIVHRRPEFRASAIMLDRAKDTANIELLTPYVVDTFEAGDDGALGTAKLKNTQGGEDAEPRHRRRVHRDRPPAELEDRRGPDRPRRRGLRPHGGQVDAHADPGRLRRGRPGRPHLPPGGHGRGQRLSGGARRRVVPARPPAGPRGALGGEGRGDRAGRPALSAFLKGQTL